MIGPAFYAGVRDLGLVPEVWRTAVHAVFGRASRSLARRAAGDLGFYETTMLTMQKKIFEDQAPMHEAYIARGVRRTEEFYRTRIIDAATLEAWRQIDAGRRNSDSALVDRGNRTLLFREQFDIMTGSTFRDSGTTGRRVRRSLSADARPGTVGARRRLLP